MSKKHPLRVSLQTKAGRYHAVFSYTGKDGKEKRKWMSLDLEDKPGNKQKAKDKMQELRMKKRGIIDVPGFEISFEDYMRDWVKKKEGNCEENSFEGIKNAVEHKIIPFFAPMKLALSEVKPKHIRDFYRYLYRQGSTKGTGLSISSIKKFKSCLNDALKRAVVEGLILSNPAESVKLPAKDNPRKPRPTLSRESANDFLGYIADDPLMYPLLLTTLCYGLRKSEVLGIKWSAVDFEKGQLRIESTIVAGKHPEKDKTKTQTSKVAFSLLPEIRAILLKRKQDQAQELLASTGEYTDPVYVFTNRDGRYLSPQATTRRFKKLLAECGLPTMRFHDLRHSTSGILRDEGMRIKELQQWMRHGKIEMTADVYLHVSEKREKCLAADVDNMLAPDNGGKTALWNGIVPKDA